MAAKLQLGREHQLDGRTVGKSIRLVLAAHFKVDWPITQKSKGLIAPLGDRKFPALVALVGLHL